MERGWRKGSATSMSALDRSRSFGNLPGAVAVGYRAGQGSGRYAGALAHNPEKLSAGLDVLFRIQALETMIGSLEQGMRKYQTPADAAALAALSAENGANRSRLERYLVNLARIRSSNCR